MNLSRTLDPSNRVDAVLQRYLILSMSLLALSACGRHPQAKADTTADSLHSSAGDVDQQPEAPKKDSSAKDTTKKDSTAEPAIGVKVAPGRPKKDSLALVSAVRYGSKFI